MLNFFWWTKPSALVIVKVASTIFLLSNWLQSVPIYRKGQCTAELSLSARRSLYYGTGTGSLKPPGQTQGPPQCWNLNTTHYSLFNYFFKKTKTQTLLFFKQYWLFWPIKMEVPVNTSVVMSELFHKVAYRCKIFTCTKQFQIKKAQIRSDNALL